MRTVNMAYQWRPVQMPRRPEMSEAGAAPAAFIDSPVMSLVTDFALALPAGILAVTYGGIGSKWGSFFWGVTALATFKGLYDLSEVAGKGQR
jgi:hypothetical protein